MTMNRITTRYNTCTVLYIASTRAYFLAAFLVPPVFYMQGTTPLKARHQVSLVFGNRGEMLALSEDMRIEMFVSSEPYIQCLLEKATSER